MTSREEITKRLLLFVNAKNWGKSDFARAAGIHRQNADRYLTGKSDPSKIAIKLMTEGLNVDWLLTGEGSMLEGKTGDKQSENARPTAVQQLNDDALEYRGSIDSNLRGIIAIGKKMTPDKIDENDFLIIDLALDPKPGDYVLRKSLDAPEIARHKAGDQKPIGVLVKLVRSCT